MEGFNIEYSVDKINYLTGYIDGINSTIQALEDDLMDKDVIDTILKQVKEQLSEIIKMEEK